MKRAKALEAIQKLVSLAASNASNDSADALRYSQAALNIANMACAMGLDDKPDAPQN